MTEKESSELQITFREDEIEDSVDDEVSDGSW